MKTTFFTLVLLFYLSSSLVAQIAEPGNCIRFNGSNGLASVTTAHPSGDATLMGWFNPNVLSNPNSTFGNQGLFGFRNEQSFYMLLLPSGRVEYRIGINGASGTINSTRFACVGGWFHVAMVYKSQEGILSAYMNGELQNSIQVGTGNFSQNNRLFTLARQQFASQNYWFNGKIDNLALINRALSHEEIIQYSSQDLIENTQDLMLYFKMNQSTGNVINGETGVNMNLSGGYFWEESDFPVMTAAGNSTYSEAAANNGSVDNSDALILNLTRATFNASISENLIETGKATIDNLPPGLIARLEILSNNSAQLTFQGNAISHEEIHSLDLTHIRLLTGALNESCTYFAYPIKFQFNDCLIPDAAIQTAQLTVCTGSLISLLATGGTSYVWNTGFEGPELEITIDEPTSIEVIVSFDNECGADTANIFISTFPESVLIISPSDSIVLCPNQTTELNASSGFNNYEWSHGPESASVIISSAGSYSVSAIDMNGCQANSNTVFVELIQFENIELTGDLAPLENTISSYSISNPFDYDLTIGVSGGQLLSENANQLSISWGNAGQGSIWLIANDQNGCQSDTFYYDINIQISTSISHLLSNNLKLYPNPVLDEITLVNLSLENPVLFIIRDLKGRNIYKTLVEPGQQTINLPQIDSGVYFLQSDEKNINLKFIKQ